MHLSDFDYKLPKELIASDHVEPRDHSRLLVLDRALRKTQDKRFFDIIDFLNKGDLLVFNDSKVFKARIFGTKTTGGRVELLLVRPIDMNNDNCYIATLLHCWECLLKGKVKVGDEILFKKGLKAEIVEKKERSCVIKFNKNSSEIFKYLEKYGETPLPPYVGKNYNPPIGRQITKNNNKITRHQDNNSFYQTAYAKNIGSVAAPTAGFHFTSGLMDKLKKKGVEFSFVTLHVGPGTFLPVEIDNIEKHHMHEEFFEVDKKTWEKILRAKKDGRRVIAVGTTTVRALETMAHKFSIFNFQFSINDSTNQFPSFAKNVFYGSTNIFIYPPYEFKIADALITNFHLPKSTLLMLVSAFLDPKGKKGVGVIKKAYKEAIEKKYRFYSFGDSMFIK